MQSIFIIAAIVFVLLILILIVLAKRKKKKKHTFGNQKKDIVQKLNEIKRNIDNNPELSALTISQKNELKDNITRILNELVDGKTTNEKIAKEMQNLQSQIEAAKNLTLDLKGLKNKTAEKIERIVADFKFYISTHSFYPKNLLFEANMIQGKVHDLNAASMEKMEQTVLEIEERIKAFEKELKRFTALSNQITKLLESNNELISGNDKQTLYFYVHNGQLDEAEDFMRRILPSSGNKEFQKDLT